jgi:hypothetical protein
MSIEAPNIVRSVRWSKDLRRKLVVEQHPEDPGCWGWSLYVYDRDGKSHHVATILDFGDRQGALEDGEFYLQNGLPEE